MSVIRPSTFPKLSSISMTRKQLYRAFKQIAPEGSGASLWKDDSLPELKRAYRRHLQVSEAPTIPLATRLESYKYWKRTGKVPALVERGGKWDLDTTKHRLADYVRSNEPITLYSGGSVKDLHKAVKDPKAFTNTRSVLPGSARAQSRTLWATPQKDSAETYARAGRTLGDWAADSPPAVARVTLPKKYVSTRGSGEEVQISPEHLKKALIQIMKVSN